MEQTDIQSSISTAKARRDLVMGLKETVRLVAAGQAELVVLASDVNSAEYKALVTAITKEGKTALRPARGTLKPTQ